MSQIEDNAKYANWLIRVGSFLAANAELFPDGFYIWSNSAEISFYGDAAKDKLLAATRVIRREFGATESEKDYESDTFRMTISIPNSFYYFSLMTPRANVCRKVETGETVTKEVIDYRNAPRITKEIPVVKWECDPILSE